MNRKLFLLCLLAGKHLDFISFFKEYIDIMQMKFLSRSFLETLSSSDLISLADDYGIDIPDNLNRRFIIGELLEVADDLKGQQSKETDMIIKDQDSVFENNNTLPVTYNETSIHLMLRNPVCAFVWWDIKESELISLRRQKSTAKIKLKIFLFSDEVNKPEEVFDVFINIEDHKQYIIIPVGYKYVKANLVYGDGFLAGNLLASSLKISIPEIFPLLRNFQPGQDINTSSILELSGIKKILEAHYTCNRQSFS